MTSALSLFSQNTLLQIALNLIRFQPDGSKRLEKFAFSGKTQLILTKRIIKEYGYIVFVDDDVEFKICTASSCFDCVMDPECCYFSSYSEVFKKLFEKECPNICIYSFSKETYPILENLLLKKGKKVEILAFYYSYFFFRGQKNNALQTSLGSGPA